MNDLDHVFKPEGYFAEGSHSDVEAFNIEQEKWAEQAIEKLIIKYGIRRSEIKLDFTTWRNYRIALIYVRGGRYHYNPIRGRVHCAPA
ncbi:hypothetical protein [Lentilitoribacter sp. Alg239-R112]|uniref:hypothetical protein n=1 Tax=Lentilitoribacter sp. Alg239-R112 TaxID=2305987 RepID=UPI0013A6E4C3|nr:hypothetical protein [Lentilitoribacter sp. Alg239-R112]